MSAWDLLPAVRQLYSERPEYIHHEPWELVHVLFSLGYVDDLADEAELAAAAHNTNQDADDVFHERVREVKEALARGVADKAWCTRFETDYGLRWNHKRQVWTSSAAEGFAYDGETLYACSRGGEVT